MRRALCAGHRAYTQPPYPVYYFTSQESVHKTGSAQHRITTRSYQFNYKMIYRRKDSIERIQYMNKKITAVLCTDDDMGLLFNKRRQSSDSELRKWLLALLDGRPLYMDTYTHAQFADEPQQTLQVSDEYLSLMSDGDTCFTEKNHDALPAGCDYIICRWNRRYPSDVRFDADPADYNIELIAEIPGSSHERITIERWTRK